MKKAIKIFGWIVLSIIVLVLGFAIFLQTPPGKRLVRDVAVDYLEKKFQTKVVIGEVKYRIPTMVGLEKVLFLDKNADTLLSMDRLSVDIEMLALIQNELKISSLELDGLYANIYRKGSDTSFNYQFIIDAFASANVDTLSKDEDTSVSAMLYNINKVRLKEITFIFNDEAGGTYFDLVLDSLLLRPKEIDPSKMIYKVEDLIVYKANTIFRSFPGVIVPPPDTSTDTSPLILAADNLRLIQSTYSMITQPDSFYLDVNVGKLEARLNLFDLVNELILLDGLNLVETQSTITMGKPTGPLPKAAPNDQVEDSTAGWRITSNKINLADINFKMDNNNVPRQGAGMDFAHLALSGMSLILDDLLYSSDTISGDLTHLALKEKSGLDVRELRTNFVYHSKGALLDNLYVLTPNTLLQDRIEVKFPSLDAISNDIGKMYVDINLAASKAAINDILIFTPPSSRSTLLPYQGQQLQLAGNIRGYINDLFVNNLNVSGLGHTAMALTGSIKGLPDPKKLLYDLEVDNLAFAYQDIQQFIPKEVSNNIRIPAHVAIKGKIIGSTTQYQPDLYIATSDGNMYVKGWVDINKSGSEKYDVDFRTEHLNLGKIIKQDTMLGIVTMRGNAKGTGFDMKSMNATINGYVDRFDFQGYAYQNVNLDASIAQQLVNLNLVSKDPNADLKMIAQIDLSQEYPSLVSTSTINSVNLQALGFTQDQLVLGGNMNLNFTSLNPDRPDGYLRWVDPILNYNGHLLDVDSIYVSATQSADSSQNIVAHIPHLLDLKLTGNIPLTQIGNAALVHVNQYFTITDTLSPTLNDYDMQLHLGLKYHPTLSTFVPELQPFDTIDVQVDMEPNNLAIKGFIPKLSYGAHNLYNLQLQADDSSQALEYHVTMDKYEQEGGSIIVFQPTLRGKLYNNTLLANFSTTDEGGVENYALGANATSNNGVYVAKLLPNLKLNYENWNVADNELAYGPNGFYINNLNISKGKEAITINSSQHSVFGSPLQVNFSNFELANLSKILNPDTLLAEGTLNGNFDIDLSDTFPKIAGKMGITNLAFYETVIGKLDGSVSNRNANTYEMNINITENQNDIHLSGLYHLEPVAGNNMDMTIDIGAINLQRFEGLAMGSIKESQGFIAGNLKITGLTSAPKINGSLLTNNLQTKLSMFNSLFKMPSEKILFENGNIKFDNFKIYDTFGQQATITGYATTQDYANYDLFLKFNSDRWLATNSTKADYENFYGKLFLTSNISINGIATAPIIEGNVLLHDSTHFTYANVDEGPGISDHEGIVQFVDRVDDYKYLQDSTNKAGVENPMTMNLNIETQKYAVFNVLVDPITGDNASVHGAAFLNASMLPGGAVSLTGTYQIEGGYYELFIELIKKQFEIRSGSTIMLAGDPMEAEINLEAVYDAHIAPYDLMEKTASQEDLVFYKQRLPFEVILRITGKPLKPIITFDIVLPDDKANLVDDHIASSVQNKLRNLQNDAAELNKQVFGILVFGRFISEDPINSGSSSSIEYYARQSASRFLSQQLNNLASKYVNGLELSLDVQSQEDYTTGQKENRTSVNLQASKKFFNDRLTINVGNDFQVEGKQLPGRDNALIPGNISLDYRLTKDGKYSIRGYRKNEVQNVIDGYVVETGTALRLNYEYNRFRQLFRSREQLREERRRKLEKDRQQEEKSKPSPNQPTPTTAAK